MGAYNEVIVDGPRPENIQFKYGRCWQYQYKIGDKISWDVVSRPQEARGKVTVGGIAQRDGEYRYYAIEIENDVIKAVHKISEQDFQALERGSS